jgi:hypothetical protein
MDTLKIANKFKSTQILPGNDIFRMMIGRLFKLLAWTSKGFLTVWKGSTFPFYY